MENVKECCNHGVEIDRQDDPGSDAQGCKQIIMRMFLRCIDAIHITAFSRSLSFPTTFSINDNPMSNIENVENEGTPMIPHGEILDPRK